MKTRKVRKGLLLVAAAGVLGLGCELIVDFDRTLIPIEGSDSAIPSTDASLDTTLDTFQPDTSLPDAEDAAIDTSVVDAADAADAD